MKFTKGKKLLLKSVIAILLWTWWGFYQYFTGVKVYEFSWSSFVIIPTLIIGMVFAIWAINDI